MLQQINPEVVESEWTDGETTEFLIRNMVEADQKIVAVNGKAKFKFDDGKAVTLEDATVGDIQQLAWATKAAAAIKDGSFDHGWFCCFFEALEWDQKRKRFNVHCGT